MRYPTFPVVTPMAPRREEANPQALHLDSTLAELPLHGCIIDANLPGSAAAAILAQHPELPGFVLQDEGILLGIVGRQRFLEFLIHPQGYEWFLQQPLRVLFSYARRPYLLLPETMAILTGAQQALRRSPDQRPDPIVVQGQAGDYWLLDIHELTIANWQLRGIETQVRYERTQIRMIQHEKMAALGRLVDGVAHEILDPVGFIWGNLVHVSEYADQLMQLLAAYEHYCQQTVGDPMPGAIAPLCEDLEVDYIKADLPKTIQSIQSGADRLRKLAVSLQNFCHIDDVYPKPADLHECLNSLVLLLENHLTGEIQFTRYYGTLPPVSCYAGQLSQVFINLLTHAVETLLNPALRATVQRELGDLPMEAGALGGDRPSPLSPHLPKPEITLSTRIQADPAHLSSQRWVVITITDNGPALTPTLHRQIMDSFSIQQRATQETSLAMSYQIVTARHGGRLELRSPCHSIPVGDTSLAIGTEFEVWLPLL